MVHNLNRMGSDTSFLEQQLNGHLLLEDTLSTSARVHLVVILTANEVLCDLGSLYFVGEKALLRRWATLPSVGEDPLTH